LGWGYGGHLTLHAMFERLKLQVGFPLAGGGLGTSTTRYHGAYIGLPDSVHEESYQESCRSRMRRVEGKLLIAHGSGDDKVHYSNTLALVDELIKAGKYVEVISYPGRHEIK